MAQVGEGFYQCAKCGDVLPKTADNFYFDRHGRLCGYCKPCQKAYLKGYVLSADQRYVHRAQQRAWRDRHHPVPPERQRARRGAA